MTIESVLRRTLFSTALLAVLAAVPALAHEGECPYCAEPVTQDTPKQDNEVSLKTGAKRIDYKCVFCAVADAKTMYKGDVTVNAPSEKKGHPVVMKRAGDKWTAAPATAHFVSPAKIDHPKCGMQYRSFTTKAAAQAFAKANKGEVLTLAQFLSRAK